MSETMSPPVPAPTPGRWRRFGAFLIKLWRRFVTALQGPAIEEPLQPPPAPRPAPGRLTERRSIMNVSVPAKGFAFHFHIHGVFVWTSEDLDRPALRSLVETFLPYARGHLKGLASGLARGVEPHRAEDFEHRLRDKLSEIRHWTYERQGLRVKCRAHVRVRLDERIQERIRPHWERMIDLDYERDIATRRARHADRVSAQWATILQRLLDGPAATGAASMTDEQLAAVVREMLGDEKVRNDALAGLGPQDEYRRAGFFDLLSEDGKQPPS